MIGLWYNYFNNKAKTYVNSSFVLSFTIYYQLISITFVHTYQTYIKHSENGRQKNLFGNFFASPDGKHISMVYPNTVLEINMKTKK